MQLIKFSRDGRKTYVFDTTTHSTYILTYKIQWSPTLYVKEHRLLRSKTRGCCVQYICILYIYRYTSLIAGQTIQTDLLTSHWEPRYHKIVYQQLILIQAATRLHYFHGTTIFLWENHSLQRVFVESSRLCTSENLRFATSCFVACKKPWRHRDLVENGGSCSRKRICLPVIISG